MYNEQYVAERLIDTVCKIDYPKDLLEIQVLDDSTDDTEDVKVKGPLCCESEPQPAKCGISRIWVLRSDRNKHIATKLLDCVRRSFLMGYPLQKCEIAFSDPTPDGRMFATKYTGTSCFLVYRHFNEN